MSVELNEEEREEIRTTIEPYKWYPQTCGPRRSDSGAGAGDREDQRSGAFDDSFCSSSVCE